MEKRTQINPDKLDSIEKVVQSEYGNELRVGVHFDDIPKSVVEKCSGDGFSINFIYGDDPKQSTVWMVEDKNLSVKRAKRSGRILMVSTFSPPFSSRKGFIKRLAELYQWTKIENEGFLFAWYLTYMAFFSILAYLNGSSFFGDADDSILYFVRDIATSALAATLAMKGAAIVLQGRREEKRNRILSQQFSKFASKIDDVSPPSRWNVVKSIAEILNKIDGPREPGDPTHYDVIAEIADRMMDRENKAESTLTN